MHHEGLEGSRGADDRDRSFPRAETTPRAPGAERAPLPSGPESSAHAVTVVIVAHNEEQNLPACLERLLWADRILMLDDRSTDGTVQVASHYTNWVLRPSPAPTIDPVHEALNFGFDQVSAGWILQVDADELVPACLAQEIRDAIRETTVSAYRIPFRTAILGRWMRYGYWGQRGGLVRLFRAGSVRYPLQAIHESATVAGKIGNLRRPIYHLPYPSVSDFIRKTGLYTSREAELISSGKSVGICGTGRKASCPSSRLLIWAPLRLFLWSLFRLGGWREGRHGIAASGLLGTYGFLELLQAWEAGDRLNMLPPIPAEDDDPGRKPAPE